MAGDDPLGRRFVRTADSDSEPRGDNLGDRNSLGQTVPLTAVPLEAPYGIPIGRGVFDVAYDGGRMDRFDKEGAYGGDKCDAARG